MQQIPKKPIPDNEPQRLKKLYQYEILGTPSEKDFDTIAFLAAQIFETPNAFIYFVDKDEIFYKATIGNSEKIYIDLKIDLGALCVAANEVIVLYDLAQYSELLIPPHVKDKEIIRFFAAAPIKTSDGNVLGAVCVTSNKTRTKVSKHLLDMLESLAKLVMEKLDTRLVNRKIVRAYDDRLHRLAHDMKNPITSISLYAQLLTSRIMAPEKIKDMSSKIEKAAKGIENNLDQLLTNARSENSIINLVPEQIWIHNLLEQLRRSFDIILTSKHQTLRISSVPNVAILGDEDRIIDILTNLLDNASKYSEKGTTIYINTTVSEDDRVVIEFRDEGQGLSESDLPMLFMKFSRLSSKPTDREKSYGLGLSIVKMLVESHKGLVWATSEGKGKGSSFFISFPVNSNMQ